MSRNDYRIILRGDDVPVEGDVIRHHFAGDRREPVFHLVLGARVVKHRRVLPPGYTTLVACTIEPRIPVTVADEARAAGGAVHDTWPRATDRP